MNPARSCWGIYRESAHSPGRIEDDRAILDSVGAALAARGFEVKLIAPDAEFDTRFANIFAMCERGPILDHLQNAEKMGSIIVNSPDAIHNTYRYRMVGLFARHRVSAPVSQIVASDASKPRLATGVWVKRYDFHATEAHDVMYAASEEGWREALRGFAKRGIPFVIAQEHVPGDLIKFYGVRNAIVPMESNWFEWFYHRDKGMLGHSFEVQGLRRAAFGAAAALGLEIFGGDAVIRADGEPVIIDINAWPSYARFRESAAQAIADLLAQRFQRRPRVVATVRS
jgi:glutathione synthase/RimK-type ligase-like ATP-grasp enzyme